MPDTPTPPAEISQEVAQQMLAALRSEFIRFMDICSEGGAKGRPVDLISGNDWVRAIRAIAAATRGGVS